MKRWLIFLFGWLTLSLTFTRLSAQVVVPASPTDTLYVVPLTGDTLPAITMKFEPLFLIPFVVAPGTALFVGGHSYQIRGKKLFVASAIKPYFDAVHDPVLTDLYTRHRRNRIIWYSASAAGGAVVFVGALQVFAAVVTLNTSAVQSANPYFWWGAGLATAGIAARVVSFRQLRKAVNYYNFEYAGSKPSVSLHVGLPSTTLAGIGLYVKF